MPIIFFGSDQYSIVVLESLLHPNADLDLQIVIPNAHSPLTTFAQSYNLPITDYQDFTDSLTRRFADSPPIGLSASFPRLFPPQVIQAFQGRLYNLHPSLLPQYRNVAPVPYALAMGDTKTGITLQRIDEKIDHGEIIAQIEESILPADSTPILLRRLFTKGAKLFAKWLSGEEPSSIRLPQTTSLIFTRKLTRESGFIEWSVLQKLVAGQPISAVDTGNPLIRLRLTHHPDRLANTLPDLIRALSGYEKVWTIADTRKGKLEISISYDLLNSQYKILLPGRPRPIPWSDFAKYYL